MDNSKNLQEFIEKHKDELIRKFEKEDVKCQIIGTSDEELEIAAKLIQKGELVAFPTETVYGLGADAKNKDAVLKIFQAKNRPLTDPVISHVHSVEQALEVTQINKNEKDLMRYLCKHFWPGALTIIVKGNMNILPIELTAGTEYIGLRCPANNIARQLIINANTLIAAPSANVFSHVSPTTPIHVFNDLYNQSFMLINANHSQYGVESTIVKLTQSSPYLLQLQVLRNGSISVFDIEYILQQYQPIDKEMKVELKWARREAVELEEQSQSAPGQLVKHYSPYAATYLLQLVSQEQLENMKGKCQIYPLDMQTTVVLGIGQTNSSFQHLCLQYFQLSQQGDSREAMYNLYTCLRLAENVQGVTTILLPSTLSNNNHIHNHIDNNQALFYHTIYDKLYRSSSGNKLYHALNTNTFLLLSHTQNQ